jgi:translocation and assembly module TamB
LKKEKQVPKKVKFRWFRRIARVLLGLIIFLILLILFIRSPWGQGIIVDKVTSYVSNKTNTKVEIDRLFITFSGNVYLDGLYLEDQNGDTLVSSKSLEVDVPLWPIIRGNAIGVNLVEWNGLRANVFRKDSIEGFNFQFLIDAFAAEDAVPKENIEDRESSQTAFFIKNIHFTDFDLKYKDDVSGIDTRLVLGKLDLKIKEMDLEKMNFHISKAEISNTNIHYFQTIAFPESEDSKESPGPVLVVDEFVIKNLTANYQSIPDGINAVAAIGELTINLPNADLTQNIIELNYLGLHNSTISVQMTSNEVEEAAEEVEEALTSETPFEFEWPQLTVSVSKIDFTNNDLRYTVNDAEPQAGKFNPDAIVLNNFYFVADAIYLKDQAFVANITDIQFKEGSGLNLSELTFKALVDENQSNLTDLNFRLNNNSINGSVAIQYSSLSDFINQPENARLNLNLQNFDVDLEELFRFQPDLKSNETLFALSKKRIQGNLSANGRLSSIDIPNTTINWGQTTRIQARGKLENVMDVDNLRLDFPIFNFETVRRDVLVFVNEEDMGISIPERISLKSNFKGALDDLDAVAVLTIPEGQIDLKASYMDKDEIAFNADVQVKQLQLGKLLKNDQLGELNLTLKTSGTGSDVNSLDADFETIIQSFAFNDYAINDLKIAGEIENGEGTIASAYKDQNLDVVFETFIQLDSISPRFVVDLDLKGADLRALGATDKDIRSAFVLHADFKGNAESFTLTSEIQDGIAIYDNQSYLLGDVSIRAYVQPDTTTFDITNKMLDLTLRSNASPEDFSEALQRHFQSYLSDSDEIVETVERDSIKKPVNLKLQAKFNKAPILSDVFLDRLQQLDTIDIQLNFSELNQSLSANILLPHIDYGGNVVDSLTLNLLSDAENFDFDFGFRGLTAGPLAISRTALEGSIVDKKLFLDFNSYFEADKIVQVNSEITRQNDTIRLHINPAELLINRREWSIPQENEIVYAENYLAFTAFSISRDNQLFELSSTLPNIEKEHISVHFENFRLSDFLNYLNPEETLATGRLNGNLIIEEPFLSPGMIADLQIEDFNVMDVPLGNLSLDAKEISDGTYDFNLALKGGDIDLDLTGDYQADEEAAILNLDLVLNEIKMSAAEGFSGGEITDTQGTISGEVKVSGTTADPQYNGTINFSDAGFRVAMLNAGFELRNESLRVDNEGLFLSNFRLFDQNGNEFSVNGKILTESFVNPEFDLQFNAKDFTALNSTRADNDLFYGTAIFDVDAKLTGDLNLPRLNLRLNVGSETDITYILTDPELEIEERDGVVIFVNREDPDDILTQTREESITVTGFAIDAVISINENAVFNVIINERTGDNLQVGGEGNLNFNIFPNGRTTLSGMYTMSKGHFEMNLYNIVNRRFEISPGSSVSWSGDPFDANLDVRAIYRVETSASSLMSSGGVGMDPGMSNRYRQQVPFLVYLNVDGELTQPLLTFSLDMPEDERGAVGGQIYGRIQQLNQQEEELNKQVFSLLVLNRFFPQSGSDGSGGGTMAIARDNLNQALSDQLNMFSNQLLGKTGIELDFGLDSYTDYQGDGAQDRTQLDITARKRLFNDRVIVSVGSEVDIQGSSQDPDEPSPVIGNVSIEYLLTEDGRFRLKGFRRNQFENVIDGQLIVNGIALIFTREFNEYKELFARAVREELEEPQSNDENQENEE